MGRVVTASGDIGTQAIERWFDIYPTYGRVFQALPGTFSFPTKIILLFGDPRKTVLDAKIFLQRGAQVGEYLPGFEPKPIPEPEPEIVPPPEPEPDPIMLQVQMNETDSTQPTEAPIQNINDNNFEEAFEPEILTKASEFSTDQESPAICDEIEKEVPDRLAELKEPEKKILEEKREPGGFGLLALLLIAGGS